MKETAFRKPGYFGFHAWYTILGTVVLLLITALSSGFLSLSESSSYPMVAQRQKSQDEYSKRKENLRNGTIAIENKTQLEVVRLEKHIDQGVIIMYLKNGYQKPITGYKFSFGVSIEYAERQNSKILPGEEIREIQPLQLGLDQKGIKILAVIFEDETADGIPHYINEINQRREGARLQATQSLRLLQEAVKLQDSHLDNFLSTIEPYLEPLTANEMSNLSPDKVAGINSTRYLTLQELRRIKTFNITKPDKMDSASRKVLTKREGLEQLIVRLKRL